MKNLWLLFFCTLLTYAGITQQFIPANFKTTHQDGFLKNMGQVRDLKSKPVSFVYYQANINGQQIFITDYGLSVVLSRPKKVFREAFSRPANLKDIEPGSNDSATLVTWEIERIDIVLKGASIHDNQITTKNQITSPAYNFYLDANQTSHQPVFLEKEILVKNVYPGIDWKVYIHKGANDSANLKYDFIVHPGADISQIKLKYSNNTKLELLNEEIKASTKMGTLIEKKPFSYLQEGNEEIHVKYAVRKNEITFNSATYDKTKTLVIDPSIFWMTYLSSTSQTWIPNSILGHDIETDDAGNIYVQLSASWGVPFPTLNPGGGAYHQNHTSSPDGAMVISKFAPRGQMLWSTYFGNGAAGRLMTRDKTGNIYALGETRYGIPSHPIPNPTIPLLNNGGYYDGVKKAYFTTRFSNNGALIWSSYYADFSSYPTDMSYEPTVWIWAGIIYFTI